MSIFDIFSKTLTLKQSIYGITLLYFGIFLYKNADDTPDNSLKRTAHRPLRLCGRYFLNIRHQVRSQDSRIKETLSCFGNETLGAGVFEDEAVICVCLEVGGKLAGIVFSQFEVVHAAVAAVFGSGAGDFLRGLYGLKGGKKKGVKLP